MNTYTFLRKSFITGLLFSLSIVLGPWHANAQTAALIGNFGVDADQYTDTLKFGGLTGGLGTNDWFKDTNIVQGSGQMIIDTAGAAAIRAQLISGLNMSFTRRMNLPRYSVIGSNLWMDAVYGRDHISPSGGADSTAFTGANKNGEDPGIWMGGAAQVLAKNDLVDVAAFGERLGTTANDHLWLFLHASMVGTSGSRYFDIEVYRNAMTYDPLTGVFSTGGPDAGHVAWVFNPDGSVNTPGDLIIAMELGQASFTAEIRIWVSQITYTTVDPLNFDFGAEYDGAVNNAPFGYADIVPESGNTYLYADWNTAATPALSESWGPPWGTINTGSNWDDFYDQYQFFEVGFDMTEIGVDPAIYNGGDIYSSSYNSILFKTRSSAAFTAALKDFTTFFDFFRECTDPPIINCMPDSTFSTDPDSCNASLVLPPPEIIEDCGGFTYFNDYNGTTDASGIYPVGSTVVTWTVIDADGNVATCSHTVTVLDDQSPDIICPNDIILIEDPAGSGFANLNIAVPATDDNCGVQSVVNDYNGTDDASDSYPIGSTVVHYTVTDVNGNSTVCSFTVTVEAANNPPVINGANGFPNVGGIIDGLETCENSLLEVCIEATDPDGDGVTLNSVIILSPLESVILDTVPGDLCFIFVPTPGITGIEQVQVVVCDNAPGSLCDTAILNINVAPAISADAGIDQEVCELDSVRMTAADPAPATGLWVQVSGLPATIQDPTLYNTDILNLQYGLSVFRWIISDGICIDSSDVRITRYQNPTTSLAGDDQFLCKHIDSTFLKGNTPLVGVGQWTQASGAPANIIDPFDPNTEVNALTQGTYEFVWTITAPGTCGPSRDTVALFISNCAPDIELVNGYPVINGVVIGITACSGVEQEICLDVVDPDGDPVDVTQVNFLSGSGSTWSDPVVGDTCFTYEPAPGYSGIDLLEVIICDSDLLPECDTVLLEIDVSPTTTAYAGADAEICETESYTVADASAENHAGIAWTSSGDGVFNDTAIIITTYTPGPLDILTGNVVLSLTAVGSSPCPDTTDSMILSITIESTSFAGADAEICETSTYLIADASASNYDTLFWTTSGSGSFSDTNAVNPTYFPSQADILDGFVVLTLHTQNGVCAIVSDDMTLTITEAATAYAGADAAICETDLSYTLLDAVATSYDSLLWTSSGDGSFDDPEVLNPTYTPGATDITNGTVDLTLTAYGSGSCVDATDAMTLDIGLQPIAVAGPDDEICETQGSYPLTGASSTNATSVLWTTDGTGTFDDPTLDNPVYTPSLSDIQDGQVMLTINAYGDGTCPDASDFMILTIWQEAIVYAGKDDTICEGSTFQPLDADAEEYTGLGWITSGDGTFNDTSLLHPVYTPGPNDIANGSVVLSLTAFANGTCPDATDDMVLTITTAPSVYAGTDAEICETGIYQVLDASASDYSSIEWTSSGTGTFNDPTVINPVYTPSQNDIDDGFVVLTLTAYGNAPCTDVSDDMTLTITGQAIAYAGADASICETEGSYYLEDAFAEDYSSLLWSTTGDGSFNDDAIQNPIYNIGPGDIASGSVELILTAFPNGSCALARDTMVLSISAQPTAFAGPDDEICETQTTYTLGSAIVTNASSILWATDGTGTFDDPTLQNPTYTPSASDIQDGQVRLSVTAFGDGVCPDASDEMLLTIWHLAQVYAGADASICEGEDYYLWDATADYYIALQWTTSGDGSFDNDTVLNPVYTPGPNDITAGSVVLTLTATSEGICPVASDDMTLNITPAPLVYAGADAEICEYDTYLIADATASNYSALLWSSGGDGTFDDPTLLNPVYTPGPGDIIIGYAALTLTAYGNSPCGDTSDVMVLTVTTAPTVYAGPDDEICETEGQYVLAEATATDYAGLLWTSSGDGTFDDDTILNPTYYPGTGDVANGLVTLTITAFGNGSCLDESDDMELTITLAPDAYAGPDAEICETDTFNLIDATASNYASLLWTTSGDGTFSDAYALNPTYYPGPGDKIYGSAFLTLTAFGNGSCADSTDTMLLTITPAPYAYAGVDAHICETETYVLIDAAAEDYASLLWTTSGDGTFSDPATLHPEYYPGIADILNGGADLALTAYGLGSCADASDTMRLDISPLPEANAGPDGEMCSNFGMYSILNASASNYTSLIWTTDGTGSFNSNTIINPIYYPSESDIENGQVVLTLTAFGDGICPDDEDFMVLTIWKAPEVYAGADAETCEDSEYWILDAWAENHESLLWSTTGDGTFDDPTLLAPVYTPGSNDITNGTVNLILTADGMGVCLPVRDTLVLTVTPLPIVDAGPDDQICENDVLAITGASATNYASLMWTTSGDGTFDDPSLINPVYTPGSGDINTGTAVLTLTAIGDGSCGNAFDQMLLTISGAAVANAGGDGETCAGNSFFLENAYAENYQVITWTTSGDGAFDDINSMNPVYTPGTADIANGSVILTITAEGIGSCEDATDSMTLTITEAATVFAGGNADICETDSYTFENATASGYALVVWSSSGDGSFDDPNLLNPTYVPGPIDISSGGVILTITAEANGSCEDVSDAMSLQIHPFPTVEAGDAGVICYGEEFQITDADAEHYAALLWTTSGDGTFSDPAILEPVYYAGQQDLAEGYATLYLTAFGYGSCGFAIDSLTLGINTAPVADAGEDQLVEEGADTQLHGNATGGSGDYTWNWTPGDYIINANAQNPTTFPIFQNTYFVLTVTDNLTGCVGRDTVLVEVEGPGPASKPIAVDDYDTTFIDIAVVVPMLENDYVPPGEVVTPYLLTPPKNGIVVLNSDYTFTYTPYDGFTGDDSLSYYICNDNAFPLCDSAMIYIHVLPLDNIDDNIRIYSGFTPNDDGINDYWLIDGIERYPDNEVLLFNRWGDIFKEFRGYDNENVLWNGTNENNKVMPDGTYYYLIKIMYNGQEKFFKGWVYLHGVSN